jgi:general stress protein YciG
MALNEFTKSSRGFASMDRIKQRAVASKGGQNVPPEKRSFSRNRVLAATAGRKGGGAVPATERSFSQDHELAAEAGRRGGHARAVVLAGIHDRQNKLEDENAAGERVVETVPAKLPAYHTPRR